MGNPTLLIVIAAIMFAVIGGINLISHLYNLNGIKSKTVGDGQHGTARWAEPKQKCVKLQTGYCSHQVYGESSQSSITYRSCRRVLLSAAKTKAGNSCLWWMTQMFTA